MNGVLTEDANEEVAAYMKSTGSIVDTQRNLSMGGITDIGDIAVFNWTR